MATYLVFSQGVPGLRQKGTLLVVKVMGGMCVLTFAVSDRRL